MKGKYAILWGLLLISFCACGDSKSVIDTLHRAEALMDEHPDSALHLISTLSDDEMDEKGNRAWYALLYTQAKHKCYIDETNDSLISVAVDYYRPTDDVRRRFLSCYYKGRILANGEDYLNATSCYMEAEQLADKVGDGYLLGLLYAELGRMYRLYYDYPKSIEAYQKAIECYERAGKITHRNYMWLNQGSVYRSLNNYAESKRLLMKALAAGKEMNDSSLVQDCLGNLVMLCVEQQKISEAGEFYSTLKSFADVNNETAAFMGNIAKIYVYERKYQQALECINKGWELATERGDSVSLYLSSSEVMNALGNKEQAYQELAKGISLQNKNIRQALQQPVLTAQRDYLSEKLEFENYRLRMEKRQKLLSTLFLLLLLGVAVYAFTQILKKHQKNIRHLEKEKQMAENRISSLLKQLDIDKKNSDETIAKLKDEITRKEEDSHVFVASLLQDLEQNKESLATSITQLRTELEALQNDNHKMTSHIAELLKNHLEHIIEVTLLHEENWHKDDFRVKRINDKIRSLKRNYFAGDAEYKKVEALVNLYLDNIMLHFRKEVSLPHETDYRRVCYMFAGLPAPVIAKVMNESKDAVYQRKSRLVKKLATLPCHHKEIFTSLLCK